MTGISYRSDGSEPPLSNSQKRSLHQSPLGHVGSANHKEHDKGSQNKLNHSNLQTKLTKCKTYTYSN